MAKTREGDAAIAGNGAGCHEAFLCFRMLGIAEDFFIVGLDMAWELERDPLMGPGLAKAVGELSRPKPASRLGVAAREDGEEGPWEALAKRYANIGGGLRSERPRLSRMHPWGGVFGAWIELDLGFDDGREAEPKFGVRKARAALRAKAAAIELDWPQGAPRAGPIWVSGNSAPEWLSAAEELGSSLRSIREARELDRVSKLGRDSGRARAL